MQILFYDANGHDRTLTAKELASATITTDTLLWVNASKAQIVKAKLPKELAGEPAEVHQGTDEVLLKRIRTALRALR